MLPANLLAALGFYWPVWGEGCLRDTDNATHEAERVSAGALRPTRGRLDEVDSDVDQRSSNYYGQETEDAHYHVVH